MLPDSEPDNLEKVVRFVCGLMTGAILAVTMLTAVEPHYSWGEAVYITGTALSFAIFAVRHGDPSWRWILKSFR